MSEPSSPTLSLHAAEPCELRFEINGLPFRVRVLDIIADNDPEAVGCITFKGQEIQILRGQTLESAFATLAHEVGHAWLGRHPEHRLPSTLEQFCESFADVMPKFVNEFLRQGGMATLAEMMCLPHDGNQLALVCVPWESATPAERQAAIIRNVFCWQLSDLQFEQYRVLYEAAGLNPLLGDCYARKTVKDGRRIAIELGTTAKALRRVAHRTGLLGGISAPQWAGDDGVWCDVWPKSKGHPSFARVSVRRTDKPDLFWGVVRWDSFAQTVLVDNREILTWFWERMDDHMLAKCAETQALGKALPQLDGLVPDELIRTEMPTAGQGKAIERRPNKMVREERLHEQLDELSDGAATTSVMHPPTSQVGRTGDRPEVESVGDEATTGGDAEYHKLILRVSKLVARTKRDGLIAEMRRKMGDVEDDNPPAFTRAVFEEAKRRWGGAR